MAMAVHIVGSQDVQDSLEALLTAAGFATRTLSIDGAMDALELQEAPLVVIDCTRGVDGEEVVTTLRERLPDAILVAVGDAQDRIVGALKRGADAATPYPVDAAALRAQLTRLLGVTQAVRDAAQLHRRPVEALSVARFPQVIGGHPSVQDLLKKVAQVALTRSTVLIRGESGTGKELIAAAIHENSPRRGGPFVRLNCAALADAVLESELFGHEKGAFTGALARREGRFKQADGGTLFLDEVSEIPLPTQVKLLRFLQEREFERVGSNQPVRVDVRVVAASNRDLKALVDDGKFREDLYYRLNVVRLEVPPLRARRSDISLLADHYLREFAQENARNLQGFTAAAAELMVDYPWPGNVRELQNCIEQAVVFAPGPLIDITDLPIQAPPTAQDAVKWMIPGVTMAELERYAVVETLKAVGGSTVKAAEVLGISRRTIQYRLKEWGLASRELSALDEE